MSSHKNYKALTSRFQKPLILLVVMFVFTLINPGIFSILGNSKSILFAVSIYGVMVCGTIYPILLGGIDLAVGATAAMGGVCVVLTIVKMDYNFTGVIPGILFGLAADAMADITHGVIVSSFNVPPSLITLASQNIVYGIAQLLTGSQVISRLEPAAFIFLGGGRLFGIPFSVCILVIVALISFWMLNRTIFGRRVYAVGGNKEASNFSDASSKRVTAVSYAISGFTAVLVDIVLASMSQQAIAEAAQGYENGVLTATVVGGTSLTGGEGSLQGAMFGVLLVRMINNDLRLSGVPSAYHSVVKGIVIIVAVAADTYGRYKNSGLKRSGILARIFNRKEGSVKPI